MKGKSIIILLFSVLAGCSINSQEPLFSSYETLDQVTKRMGKPNYQIDNRYIWDKRYDSTNVGDNNSLASNPISFAQANTAYMQNIFCHVTVITDQDSKILLKEIEGGMCKDIYGSIFLDSNDEEILFVGSYNGYTNFSAFGIFLYAVIKAAGSVSPSTYNAGFNWTPPPKIYISPPRFSSPSMIGTPIRLR